MPAILFHSGGQSNQVPVGTRSYDGVDLLNRSKFAPYLFLGGITLLAAILRFYRLGAWSLWGDEAFTLGLYPDGFMPSLSTGLIRAAVKAFGPGEWSARLVPAVIGVLSVPVLYFPLQRLFGSFVALVAGLLLAVSPWHIYWSQNARFYPLLLLFYTLSWMAFAFGIERNRPAYILLSLLFLGLAAQERLFALVLVPVIVSDIVLIKLLPFELPVGLRPRRLLSYSLPLGLLSLIFAGPFLRNLDGWMGDFGRVNTNPVWIAAGFVYYVGLPVIFFGALGGLYRLLQKDRNALLVILGAILPLAGIMALSLFHYSANRYAFVSLPCWIILASLGLKELFTHLKGRLQLFAVGLLLMVVSFSLSEDILYFKYQNGNREDWRSALTYVRDRMAAADLVVTSRTEMTDYYLPEAKAVAFDDLQPEAIEQSGRVWFIEDMNISELHPRVLEWILANARLEANFDVHAYARNFKMRVYLYDPADLTSSVNPFAPEELP
jgi:4-amino-4-deoxy-L-arabinose transferase-like glycosyltransferase